MQYHGCLGDSLVGVERLDLHVPMPHAGKTISSLLWQCVQLLGQQLHLGHLLWGVWLLLLMLLEL